MSSPAAPVPAPWRGILLLLVTVFLFAFADAVAKFMRDDYATTQIVWARYLFQLLVMVPLFARYRLRELVETARPVLQISRGILALVSIYLFIFALAYIPLADGIAIGFINPVLVVAMAAVFLREPIGPGRWLAVGVGFGGAMIILRPGLGVVHWAGLLVVVSAAAFSIIQIQTRMLSATDRPVTTFFYISAVGVVLTSIAVPFVWRAPTLEVWLLLALQGGLSGIAQYAFIRAYDYAQASVLAPFNYVEILGAALLGYLFFADVPDRWTIAGAAIIMATGLYVLRGAGATPAPAPAKT